MSLERVSMIKVKDGRKDLVYFEYTIGGKLTANRCEKAIVYSDGLAFIKSGKTAKAGEWLDYEIWKDLAKSLTGRAVEIAREKVRNEN